MTTTPVPQDLSLSPLLRAPRRPARRAAAALVAGGLLAGVLGFSAPVAALARVVTPVDWSTSSGSGGWDGSGGWGGSDGSGGSDGTSSGAADANPATSAQSKGVALINTV